MAAAFVYITAGSKEEATTVGSALVEERLVACVNVLDGMTSLYWWEGKVNHDGETVLVAKTRQDLVERVIERVKTLHSYDCPCVVSWPITQGNPAYLKWIEDETSRQKGVGSEAGTE